MPPVLTGGSLLLLLCFTGLCFGDTVPSRTAILLEPDLPVFAGQLSLQPHKIKGMLAQVGLSAEELSAEQMADPNQFNKEKYDVAILCYGNAFPLNILENLRKFKKAGGAMIVNGVPFCHPAEFQDGKWHDKGHIEYYHHNEKGIGTGSFGDPLEGTANQRCAKNNPLGITAEMLPRTNENIQWLNEQSFPEHDVIIPIVETKAGDDFLPAVALIKHRCEMFPQAKDMWMGVFGKQLEETDYYYLKQLLVRGLCWLKKEAGSMSEIHLKRIYDTMDKLEKPSPLPSDIKFSGNQAYRPWGETFLPKSKQPAKMLMRVDASNLKRDEKIALSCLQGLTSRKLPAIWINFDQSDQFWLDWHKNKGYIKDYKPVDDWKTLFKKYSKSFNGAVIADADLYRGDLIAINVASCEDLIVCTEGLAEELEIEIKVDLRGRFKTYSKAMAWIWDSYKDQLNRYATDMLHPNCLDSGAFAYDVQFKNMIFWIAGPADAGLPGADSIREMSVMSNIYAQLPPNIAMLGFPDYGEGTGLGEVGGTAFCGGYGKSLICTDRLSNVPITSGVRIKKLKQKRQPSAPELEDDKVYIAMVYSDGDNQNVWRQYFLKNFFINPNLGEFPISFGIGPAIMDIQPAVAQWYYENAPATTEFISDVSGIGYMRPESFANRYASRDTVFDGFLHWTKKYMEKMDLHTVRTVSGSDEVLKKYIEELPFMHSFFADMGTAGSKPGYENKTYKLRDMHIFRSLIGWGAGREGFVEDIKKNLPDERPAFVNVLAHAWTLGNYEHLKEAVERMPEDWILVTPKQLADLAKKSKIISAASAD